MPLRFRSIAPPANAEGRQPVEAAGPLCNGALVTRPGKPARARQRGGAWLRRHAEALPIDGQRRVRRSCYSLGISLP